MLQWTARTASAIGALLGLWFGYDVGREIAGAGASWLAWLMALNAALFGALMGSALIEWLARALRWARAARQ